MPSNPAPRFMDRCNTWLLSVLPQQLLARAMYHLARSKTTWLKNTIIRYVVKRYQVDMQQAQNPNPLSYESFNAFFTRSLRAGIRPIAENAIVSPADGTLGQCGYLQQQRLLQAKGHEYSLVTLLAGDPALAEPFTHGSFVTVYLSPRDYHRIHMPLSGSLREMIFVPGKLFSVSEATTQLVPGLFARNERLICLFDTAHGCMAVILVGAIFVGSMQTVWSGEVKAKKITRWQYTAEEAPQLATGEELGRFNMGSTVIVLLAENRAQLLSNLTGKAIQMGQKIAD